MSRRGISQVLVIILLTFAHGKEIPRRSIGTTFCDFIAKYIPYYPDFSPSEGP